MVVALIIQRFEQSNCPNGTADAVMRGYQWSVE